MADGGHNAANLYLSRANELAPIEYRDFPRFRLPIERPANGGTPQVPPRLKGYRDTRVEDGGRMVPPLLPVCAVAIRAERLKSHERTVANERGAVQPEEEDQRLACTHSSGRWSSACGRLARAW